MVERETGAGWRVWVTGAGGLIGNQIVQSALTLAPKARVRGLTRQDFDLTDIQAVSEAFVRDQPTHVVHCAAISRSAECESFPKKAFAANVDVTVHLARLAERIPFLFFSSDLVFDGRKGNYLESDPVNPLSIYGETKAIAETLILANPSHTVVRTSLNGGPSPSGVRGFSEELLQAWNQSRTTRLFTDEYRCPAPAVVTAEAIWRMLLIRASGLYHVAGGERLSRWQIGQIVAQSNPGCHPNVEPASLSEYIGAPRPPDCSLRLEKLSQRLGWHPPGLTEWLAQDPGNRL
jgi:dTDP-4-dehydrorhamnose reductase